MNDEPETFDQIAHAFPERERKALREHLLLHSPTGQGVKDCCEFGRRRFTQMVDAEMLAEVLGP